MHTTTVRLRARVPQHDAPSRTLPQVRVTLADQHREHRFTAVGEEHDFVITSALSPGTHWVTLESRPGTHAQAPVEVLDVWINGAPMGTALYRCEYRPHHTGETLGSHTWLGWPGVWRWPLRAPVHEHMEGVGFD